VSETALVDLVSERAGERSASGRAFFGREAERLALCCREMATRFAAGGRLLAVAEGPAARSDAEHVAVEFVHPVIVGKRALPALAITADGAAVATELAALARADDVVIAFGAEAGVAEACAAATRAGCMTIGFGCDAEWRFETGEPDPFAAQEIVETAYHLLWELVHVFFEHGTTTSGGAGAAGFLYPYLEGGSRAASDDVVADVRASALAKAEEVAGLRERTLIDHREVLAEAAEAIRAGFDGGGSVLAFGNGGSATDAADLVADLRLPPERPGEPPLHPRAAIDLSAEPAVLSAIANDVGVEHVFSRQIVAHAGDGDVAVAISTSGDSANLVAALEECRRRGIASLALVGGSGGRIAAEGLADWLVHVRSDHIPRIQEAQASVLHVLRELLER
jgi:D-sedoheptulose 7-phosphate isomerase